MERGFDSRDSREIAEGIAMLVKAIAASLRVNGEANEDGCQSPAEGDEETRADDLGGEHLAALQLGWTELNPDAGAATVSAGPKGQWLHAEDAAAATANGAEVVHLFPRLPVVEVASALPNDDEGKRYCAEGDEEDHAAVRVLRSAAGGKSAVESATPRWCASESSRG